MESWDREDISRILKAAIASLSEEVRGDDPPSNPVTMVRAPSNATQLGGAPIVILVHPNANGGQVVRRIAATEIEKLNSCGCSHNDSQGHSSHERFPLSEPTSRDSSKMCFIEPEKVCVGSGACEARGY